MELFGSVDVSEFGLSDGLRISNCHLCVDFAKIKRFPLLSALRMAQIIELLGSRGFRLSCTFFSLLKLQFLFFLLSLLENDLYVVRVLIENLNCLIDLNESFAGLDSDIGAKFVYHGAELGR